MVCEPFATALASCDRCDPQTIRVDCGSQKESRPTDKFERRESVVQSKDECVGDKVQWGAHFLLRILSTMIFDVRHKFKNE